MIRLHLLGFTPDLKGLVFTGRRGGRSGTYWVAVEDELWRALTQLEGARAEREEAKAAEKQAKRTKGKGKPAKAETRRPADKGAAAMTLADVQEILAATRKSKQPAAAPEPEQPRLESKLSPREVQQMLREGRSVKEVASLAGTDAAWVERFLGPVLHERGGVISMTRSAFQERSRLGRSGLPIGDAVVRNLQHRKATQQTLEHLDDSWDAKRARTGMWRVRLRFTHRGKRRSAEWDFSKESREVSPRNQLARELGWWPAPQPGPVRPAADDPEDVGEAEALPVPRPRRRAAPKKAAKRSGAKTKGRTKKKTPKRAPSTKRRTRATGTGRASRTA